MNRTVKLGIAALAATIGLLAPAPVSPRPKDRPVRTSPHWENEAVAGGGYLAWQQISRGRPDRADVFLRKPSGRVVKVNRAGTHGGLGGIDDGTLVYQEWRGETRPFARGSFSRIVLYDLKTGRRTVPPRVNGADWEYMPSMWGPWIFYGIFDEFGSRSVVGVDRDTGETVHPDRLVPYLQPGQVNEGLFAWVSWEPGGGRSRVYVYEIETRGVHQLRSSRWQWAPSVGPQGAVYVLETDRQCGSSPVVKRYARTLSGGFSAGKEVLRLPEGVDSSWSSSYADPEGRAVVVHQRLRCGTRWGSDIYRFSDVVGLTVAKDGSGDGTVIGDGIDCGEDCSESLNGGAFVTLRAEPDLTSHFAGWSRDCAAAEEEGSCVFRVDEAQTVTATFDFGPRP